MEGVDEAVALAGLCVAQAPGALSLTHARVGETVLIAELCSTTNISCYKTLNRNL